MYKRGPVAVLGAVFYHCYGKLYSLLGRRFIVKNIYNYRMYLDLQDRGISRTLLLFGKRELEHKKMLEEVLKPGMTVLDIGANIGYYALMELNLIGRNGKLIAVEPSPSNVELLKRNIELNGYFDIEVYNAAISNYSGNRLFHLSNMSNLNTFHDVGTGVEHLSGQSLDVKTFTVPEIMKGRPLDLIRMDVEGHEVEVLDGLLPAIVNNEMSPMIIFETHLTRYGPDHDIELILRRLFKAGYCVKSVGSSSKFGSSQLEARGYKGGAEIKSDGDLRKIFKNISESDTIDLICREGGIRTILLTR